MLNINPLATYLIYKKRLFDYYHTLKNTERFGFWAKACVVAALLVVVGFKVLSFVFVVAEVFVVIGLILGLAYLLNKDYKAVQDPPAKE
jgi:uncharacterized membrane protein YbaN (DUF454 family)